jgi:hypothetical protein
MTKSHLLQEIQFDLLILRFSFLMEILSCTLIALAPTTSNALPISAEPPSRALQALFVFASGLTSFGTGAMPALQSVALSLLQLRSQVAGRVEGDTGVGRLFGAIAMIQAFSQTVLGVRLCFLALDSIAQTLLLHR